MNFMFCWPVYPPHLPPALPYSVTQANTFPQHSTLLLHIQLLLLWQRCFFSVMHFLCCLLHLSFSEPVCWRSGAALSHTWQHMNFLSHLRAESWVICAHIQWRFAMYRQRNGQFFHRPAHSLHPPLHQVRFVSCSLEPKLTTIYQHW